ncbi:tetratricopeptide repeat protein [Allokutzneria albata]|uniref:tetratricopeptide repeat protein n=1 Tax=Allokutzneria albata TaxID=211114 RepID=UPI00138DFDF1|nr:tetratricopeptide repeat protein [Allokutzneria albata]
MADPRYEQAKALHRNGRPAEASALLTDLLAEHPGDVGARYALAVCQLDLGARAEARANLRQVIEDYPGHHAAEYLLARELQDEGDLVGAAAGYRRVLAVTEHPEAAARLHQCERTTGIPPVRRMIEHTHVADRGNPVGRVRTRARHLIPSVVRALAVLVLLYWLPALAGAVGGMIGRNVAVLEGRNLRTQQRFSEEYELIVRAFIAGTPLGVILGLLLVLAWIYLIVTLAAVPLQALLNGADLYEYGMDVHTGVLKRSTQFVWYYQITEPPTYLRTLSSYLTHTASLRISYNDTASTTAQLDLSGIDGPQQVHALRTYLQSRIPSERLPIRGPWT